MFSVADRQFMTRALRLAERGRYWARPNPHVGCVLTRDERIVGKGFTQPAGGDHAEVAALRAAGSAARGSTAYVTLEPCSHFGRTPPCADALVAAGVRRVVVAVADPNPRVDGSGIARLQAAGIPVETGLMAAAVEAQLSGFLARQRRGRGRLRVKMAASLDGRTAMASGESQWITGPAARRDVQRLRAASCAIVTGIGTVLADDCALTVRDEYFDGDHLPAAQRRALRVVLDSALRVPATAAVLRGEQPTLLVHAQDARVPGFLARADLAGVTGDETGLDLQAVLALLAARECNEILLESGPALAGAMLQRGLVDELILYIAPVLLGSRARPLFELPIEHMADAFRLSLVDQRQIGPDRRLVFQPHPPGS